MTAPIQRTPRAARYGTAILAAYAWMLAASTAPHAADMRNGEQLARRWCAACHLVGDGAAVAVPNAAPPFDSAARARTAEQLKGFLAAPHGSMPDPSLARSEIDDLVAYILSQR